MRKSNLHIYIIKCRGNKYYVGKTLNPNGRMKQHIAGNGAIWTKKYPPIKQVELISNCDVYDEDKYTVMYMDKYGISNVRGGSYCQIVLRDYQLRNLKNQINSATDRCHRCGKNGHFIADCPKNNEFD